MKAGSDIIPKITGCRAQKLYLLDINAVSNQQKFANLSQNQKKFVKLSQNRKIFVNLSTCTDSEKVKIRERGCGVGRTGTEAAENQ